MFWINLIGFQLCWIACVWGGANGYWWLGPVAVTLFLAWQTYHSNAPGKTLTLVAIAAVIGFLVDSGYALSGLIRFATAVPFSDWAPVWIVAMWVSFTLTLNNSLAWLKAHTLAAVALGLLGGPFAYWVGGTTWSAFEFTAEPWLALGVIGLVWAFATPALLWLAHRVDPPLPAEGAAA